MGVYRRLSKPSVRVLTSLYDAAPDPMYGMQLMDSAHAPSGTIYPILARFRDRGWLTAEREGVDPSETGRPARTYYKLTPDGLAEARKHTTAPSTAGLPAWEAGRP